MYFIWKNSWIDELDKFQFVEKRMAKAILFFHVTIYALIIISDLKRIKKKEALSASKEAIHPPLIEVGAFSPL